MSECIDHGGAGPAYASQRYAGRVLGKHVVALIRKTGEEPRGRHALHSCNNRGCINPDHLRWGTPSENGLDRRKDGTNSTSRHKLTPSQMTFALENFKPHDREYGFAALARRFGVTGQALGRVLKVGGYR